MSLFSPLKIQSFRLMFFGQLLSDFGNWVHFTALATLIAYHWELGPGALAAFTITLGIPWILIAPICSVWINETNAKVIMVLCDLARAITTIGLIFSPNIYVLYSCLFSF
ncbi:hypothetical protein LC087_03200 [Bacillus carboniphilus]|uniref:MFS transporter n=1 Tax=Bacillus carboniphilus TaxID=86663 RepID=A0ABY9JY08_9BACI|nr:hypothetical protein [Bacillus carboniphilus]WLR43218.1 hypothetical protein LC087_03200 [Bacillus carboniphilus]